MLEWYNLIFLIPIAVGLLLIAGSAFGLGHEAGHDIHHDVGHDAHHDHGHDGHHGHDKPSVFGRALSLLGVGRVPLTTVLMMASLLFGGIGYILNTVLAPVLRYPFVFFWFSLVGAFLGMVFTTGWTARFIARFMPSTETYNVSKEDLVGRSGTLMLEANASGGLAQIADHEGNVHQVTCKTDKGSIQKGEEVLTIDYDPQSDTYVVVAMPKEKSQTA